MNYLDMLVKLGIGNAHPGGFQATLKQFEKYPIPPNSKILEVGCGTGRTSCYLASQGHEVTGIDIRPDMIKKAKLRAAKQHVSVQFLVGDATAIPFQAETYDIVLVESVSIFTNTAKALAEYYRVLRLDGKLYDREMVRMKPTPEKIYKQLTQFYQVKQLWGIEEWTSLMRSTAYKHIQMDGPYAFTDTNKDLMEHPDCFQTIDSGAFLDQQIWKITNTYNQIMKNYRSYIGSILLIATK